MTRNYKSEACAVVHDLMSGLCSDGLIDEAVRREFNDLCLESTSPLTPEEIAKLREREVLEDDLEAGYKAMAGDKEYETEAQEWCHGLMRDFND